MKKRTRKEQGDDKEEAKGEERNNHKTKKNEYIAVGPC